MKFSAQEEYGLRCLIAIAKHSDKRSLTIPEISELEGLSQPHVAKLLALLRKGGWIKSSRGQLGGYSLNKPVDKIILGEILAQLGGRLYEPGFCQRHSGLNQECNHSSDCNLIILWIKIQAAVDYALKDLTLKDLINGDITRNNHEHLNQLVVQ